MNGNKEQNTLVPLSCMRCGKDLLATRYGVVVWVRDEKLVAPQHYKEAYWACKGSCDMKMQAELGVLRKPTKWRGIDELLNPLEYRLWVEATSDLIRRGRLHGSAATNTRRLNGLLAQVASREPTDDDEDDYWRFRAMDGL